MKISTRNNCENDSRLFIKNKRVIFDNYEDHYRPTLGYLGLTRCGGTHTYYLKLLAWGKDPKFEAGLGYIVSLRLATVT
jgi:hypothetical protein